jgi:hypothetical protein
VFFRVQGHSGQNWRINNVGGPAILGGGVINTGWYEWDESIVVMERPPGSSILVPPIAVSYALQAVDSAYPWFKVWAYATVDGMADSITNTFIYDPSRDGGPYDP